MTKYEPRLFGDVTPRRRDSGVARARRSAARLTFTGIDGTTSQTIYAGTDYLDREIRFGMRFADMMTELSDGRLRVDFGRFDELVRAD